MVNHEEALIGSILLSPADSFEQIETLGITPADLIHEDTRLMLTELLVMTAKGEPIDETSLSLKMPERFRMNVWEVSGSVAAPSTEHYGQAILEAAKRKELSELGQRLISAASNSEANIETLQDQALTRLSDTQSRGLVTKSETLKQAAARIIEDLDNPPRMTPTPWPALNQVIGGLRPGALYVIAASPAVGKSLMALQLAESIATAENQVAYFSFEMSSDELATRALARKSGIDARKIDRRDLTQQDKEALAIAYRDLNPYLHFIGTLDKEVTHLKADLRSINRQSGNQLGAVFIDYLGLMTAKGTNSLYEKVTAISGELKSVAMQFNIPLVVLSQLNRKGVERSGPPVLSDLRDSGSVESDADSVLMLSNEQPGKLSIGVAKNRQGPEAFLRGTLDKATMTLVDLVKI